MVRITNKTSQGTNDIIRADIAKTSAPPKSGAAKTSGNAKTNTRHSNTPATNTSLWRSSSAQQTRPQARVGQVNTFTGYEDGFKAITHSNAREQSGRVTLILVFSDMCGYCHQLRPTWDAVKTGVQSAGIDVAEYDIDTLRAVAPGYSKSLDELRSNVSGVPYIAKLYPDQSLRPFTGDRTAPSIISFALGDTSAMNTSHLQRIW